MKALRRTVLLGIVGTSLICNVGCESVWGDNDDLYNTVVPRSGGGYDAGSQIASDYQTQKGVFAPTTKKN